MTYTDYFFRGIRRSLSQVPFHRQMGFIDRYVLLDNGIHPASDMYIVAHRVTIENENLIAYTELHQHTEQEVNLVVSAEPGGLTYEFLIDQTRRIITSPATVVIPPNTAHAAKALSGRGWYVCIINAGHYKAHGQGSVEDEKE